MANQMTYAQAIVIAIEAIGETNAEATDRLKALQAQLAKRNASGSKGMTKTQKTNEVIKKQILDILAEAEGPIGTVGLMVDPRLPEISVQKLGALLGQLVKDGKVEKGKDKKHVVYSLADSPSAEGDAQ